MIGVKSGRLMHKNLNKLLVASMLIAGFLMFTALSGEVAAVSEPKDTKSGSTLEQRVTQRKAEREIKLNEEKKNRIVSSCKAAQNLIRGVRDSYVAPVDKRSKAYNQVDAKLWVIIGGLKIIEFDTFKLEQQRSELLSKFNAYEKNYAQFKQALDDAVNINCEADPVGFQALLETARIYSVKIRNQLNDITNFINNEIRQTLSSYAENLKVKVGN